MLFEEVVEAGAMSAIVWRAFKGTDDYGDDAVKCNAPARAAQRQRIAANADEAAQCRDGE